MTTPRTGDPESKPRPPAVPKQAPLVQSSPLGSTINERTATDPSGRLLGSYLDNAKYPGLLMHEQSGMNQTDYNMWLKALPTVAPDRWALIQQFGGPMQEVLWRAYADVENPNKTLNKIAAMFPGAVAPVGGGGRGGGGRGGGGGTAAPTPEQIAAAKAAIKNRAYTLGRQPFTDDELTWVATTVVRDNWSNEQLDDWLTTGDQAAKIDQPGLIAANIGQIKQMASAQLLNVSDATAREWATRIESGEMSPEAVKQIFATQAAQEFGWAANGIASGQTVRDMLLPARDRIANELEMNADAIDLMDPRWRGLVTTTDQNGQVRAATMTEVTQHARQQPEFASTTHSGQLAADTFSMIRQAFEGS